MQPEDAARSAFTLSLVHQRRDERRITSVALLRGGQRVFVGLDNGVVEEHRCYIANSPHAAMPGMSAVVPGISARVLRLLAEKKVFSKQAVAEISPADAAARLVCMADDGTVALVSLETFAVVPLPAARGAVAIAAQPSGHQPVLLAVAIKAGQSRTKVVLFSVLPGATTTGGNQPAVQVFQVQVPAAVSGLAWAGTSLLLAVPDGYYALRPQNAAQVVTAAAAAAGHHAANYQLTLLADHLSSIRPLLGSIPDLGLGLMAWEDNMVLVTDAAGAAVREPLQLPLPPLALASAGLFVVAVCDDGVYVFDRSSSKQVQQIEYAHDDAYVGLAQKLPAAADAGGRCICLATSAQVLWLEPVALEQQVRELLKRKRYEQALELISSSPSDPHSISAAASPAAAAAAGGDGPSWQQVALAQAGLLRLLDADFEGGLSVLEGLPGEVWQPCQLFSLFPGIMARWIAKVPKRSYWGLHGQTLPDLTTLIHDAWELRIATTPRHIAQQQQLPATLSPAELQGLAQQAKTSVAAYLTQVRQRPGLLLADGVDTLLLQLLCDVGDAAAVELLLSGQHAAAAAAGETALRAAQRWHGLALLQMHTRQHQAALTTWKDLAAGHLTEAHSTTGAVADAGGDAAAVAVAAAAAAMAASSGVSNQVPLHVLLDGNLEWLLQQDAAASLVVLEARGDLPVDTVLRLLQGCPVDLRWQYLYHQVYHNHSMDRQLHTQLGSVLLSALAVHSMPPAAGATDDAGTDEPPRQLQQQEAQGLNMEQQQQQQGHVKLQELAEMVYRLPLLFAPNTATEAPSAAAAATAYDAASSSSHGAFLGHSRPPSCLFASAAGGAAQQDPHHAVFSTTHRHTGSLTGGGIPPASFFTASVAELHRGSSNQLLLLPGASPSAAAAGPIQEQLQPSPQRLLQQASSLQQQHHPMHHQQQQQQQRHAGLGALAGCMVQPKQQIQQQQGFSLGFSLGATASMSVEQQQHQQGVHGHSLSRTLSSIAQLLQQQQQHQQQQARPATTAGRAPGTAAGSAVALEAAASSAAARPHLGIRVLPAGLGPLPLPAAAAVADAANADAAGAGQPGQTAAAVEGGQIPGPTQARAVAAAAAASAAKLERVLLLRSLLVFHLQASLLYDVEVLLSAAQALPLYPEQALLHSRAGSHVAALLLLALLPPRLVEGAIAYCRALGCQEAWLALLELFLNPSASVAHSPVPLNLNPAAAVELAAVQPDYASACRVLNAEGASLNPLRLLAALPANMPLHLAGNVLGRMISGLQHRHRQGQVVRSLHRCRHLSTHAELVELQSGRVLLTDDTTCNGCGRLIGSKVFFRLPSGVVVCSRCSGAVGSLAAASPEPQPAKELL